MSDASRSDVDVEVDDRSGPELLVDRYLPDFDVTLIEHRVVDATPETTWEALSGLDLMEVRSPLLDAALLVRDLPDRVTSWIEGRPRDQTVPEELRVRGDDIGLDGWLPLGEAPGREIALGAVGRFWQPTIDWYDVSGMTPDEFASFDEPGWGRIAASFSLLPYGAGRTLASYEARTATADTDSARRFERYWWVVRPFVGHVMRATLDTLRRDAELRAGR